jgi:hypothetical protein
MSDSSQEVVALAVSDPQPMETLEYKTIWCRLENGGYFHFRSHPAFTADRLVNEYNLVVQPERLYYAFPIGFNANCMGESVFAPVLLQAMEDHLQRPDDVKYRRIKEQVVALALQEHGMPLEVIKTIEQEITAIYKRARGSI